MLKVRPPSASRRSRPKLRPHATPRLPRLSLPQAGPMSVFRQTLNPSCAVWAAPLPTVIALAKEQGWLGAAPAGEAVEGAPPPVPKSQDDEPVAVSRRSGA